MADFTVGVSLQTNTYNALSGTTAASSTVPFSGINSYDFTGSGGTNASYTPLFGRECWGYNDFTLEAFVRGNGTTAEGNILYLPFNEGGDIDEYGRRMLCGINSSSQIFIQNSFRSNTGFKLGVILIDIDTPDPSTWYHLAIVRKNNKLYVLWNGERVAYDIDSAGNGSFLDGGSISNIEGLGFLFKPFGGIDSTYPSRVREFVLGSLIGTFPNFQGYIANFRSSYIAQYGVTQSTYTVPTAAFVGDESGTAYYAKTFSGSGQNNAGTAIPQAGINSTFVIQPEATVALGTVDVQIRLLVPVTGQSLSTSLGTITDKQGFDVFGSLLQVEEGTITTEPFLLAEANGSFLQVFEGTVNPIVPTGQNLTTSLGTAVGGLSVLVPTTSQNLTISLGNINLPVSWTYVSTGTTSTWTPVDTGEKAIGP